MNLEERLNKSLNDILRTSGYVFEIINNNRRQSNLITGPNNQLIPPPMMEQLAQKIAGFELILDDTVTKFNDVPWCVEQIVQNKKKQEEQKQQEELEKQQREAEKKRQEEEKKRQEEQREKERAEKEEREQKEQEEREKLAKQAQNQDQNQNQNPNQSHQDQNQNISPNHSHSQSQGQLLQYQNQQNNEQNTQGSQNEPMDSNFDLNLDIDKDIDIPNPSDILSMNYKDNSQSGGENGPQNPANMDMNMMKGSDSLLDDLNMDLLGEDFDAGQLGGAGEEEFDVENFLNQFGHGD